MLARGDFPGERGLASNATHPFPPVVAATAGLVGTHALSSSFHQYSASPGAKSQNVSTELVVLFRSSEPMLAS